MGVTAPGITAMWYMLDLVPGGRGKSYVMTVSPHLDLVARAQAQGRCQGVQEHTAQLRLSDSSRAE